MNLDIQRDRIVAKNVSASRWCRFGLSALTVVAGMIVLPDLIEACPRCYGSTDIQVIKAYYASAFLLSALPLAIVGAGLYALLKYRKRRKPPDDSSV